MGSPEVQEHPWPHTLRWASYGIPKRTVVVHVPCRRKDFTTVGKMLFFACGPRSVTGSPMESDAERRVSDPVHLEHAVIERGLKVPTHNVILYE